MAYNLGSAYIQIVPSTKGLGRGIEKELAGVGARAGSSRGGGMGGKLWSGLKVGAGVAGAAIGGVLAGSITKGFNRLRDIENAEAKLSGLGHSAEDVQKIMDNALNAVKGTSFGMGEAASLAGTLVASGIKPGEELEKTLALTADSATIAGRELSDMGLIWGSVAAKGKLQGDDAHQLLASGVPIWQMVADVMGVTAGEAADLGSKGKVSFEVFREAMENGVGGAAQASGKTTEGAFKNMGAAMGRFGATLLKDVYPLIGPLFGKITELFDYLEGAAGPAIDSVVNGFKSWVASDGVQTMLGTLRDVGMELYERVLKPLGTWITDNWKPISMVVGGIFAAFAGGALITAVGAVGAAIGGIFSVAGVVTAAIGAVVGGLAYFFTQTETGQAIVSTAWNAIKTAVGAVVTWFTTSVWPVMLDGWDYLKWAVSETWPVIQSVFSAIGSYIQQIWTGVIQPALTQFAGFIRDTVMPIIQRLWIEYVQPAFMAIGALAQWLWYNAISPALTAIAGFISGTLAPAIVWLWENVISPVFGLIGRFIGWVWNTLIFPYLDAMKYFIGTVLPPILVSLWETIKRVWSGISTAISATVNWITGTAVPFIQAAWTMISNGAKWLWGAITSVWNGIKAAVAAVVRWFQTWVAPVIQMVVALIKLGFEGLKNALSAAWSFIKDRVIAPVVAWFRDVVAPLFAAIVNRIKAHFVVFQGNLRRIWAYIRHYVINPVIAWFRDTVAPLFARVIANIRDKFSAFRDRLKSIWNFVKNNIIAPVANWFRDKIEPLFGKATDSTGNAFKKMKDTVKAAWDGIKNAAKAPIRFVVNTVINDALIGNFNTLAGKLGTKKLPKVSLPKGFAGGGILPGQSRMRDGDDQLVPMRKGEGVLVSEGLRTAKDKAAFMAANAAGRRGVGFASLMGGGFAGGGILDKVKDVGGDAWDAITGAADWVGSAIMDPKKAFTSLIDTVIGNVPGAGLLRDAAIAIPKKIVTDIASKITSSFGGDNAGGGKVPQGGASGVGWSRASSAAAATGLTMTSGYRSGARTAGSGSRSLHSMGRARDYAGSGSAMRSFFNMMDAAPYPTELLYSPMGGRNIHRGGGRYPNTGATKRNHYNHVHVGFNKGGIFDQGGLMQPGMTGINLTKKPEAVLDPAQTRAYQAHAAAITGGSMDLSPSSIDAIADALASRPNVLQIGNRQAGQLAMAGAQARTSLGGR